MQLDLWTERAAIATLGAKQRLYDADAVEHVMLIAQARDLGFSVDAAIEAAAAFRARHGLDQRPHRRLIASRGVSAADDALDDLLALARVPAPTFDEGDRIAWLQRRLAGAPGRARASTTPAT